MYLLILEIDFSGDFIDIKYRIKARISSILSGILGKLTNGSGVRLNLQHSVNNPDGASSFIIEYLKGWKLSQTLFSAFDVAIGREEVFMGARDPSFKSSPTGLENKLYNHEINYETKGLCVEAFQTYIIETVRFFQTSLSLVLECMADSNAPSAKLPFINELYRMMVSQENFYGNLMTNLSEEYFANYFVMIAVLMNFNEEKDITRFERVKLFSYEATISEIVPALFYKDGQYNYPLIFASKINQCLLLSNGFNGDIVRPSTVTSAVLSLMHSILVFWRKTCKVSRPNLVELLTGSKMPPSFCGKILAFVSSS